MDNEVHTAYDLGDLWCLVCELSVVLFDESLGREVATYHHHEVLVDSWWVSGRLMVEDFEGQTFQFNLNQPVSVSELKPIEAERPDPPPSS
jgi:hypothetical protein